MTVPAVSTAIAQAASPGIRISDVRVGERARQDFGDLNTLKSSIAEHGLLQPIVLLPDNYLLCGGRRLQACHELGWDSIPAVWTSDQGDAISRLKAERDENTCRKEMTPSELVAIGKKLEELKRPEAEQRQRDGQRRGAAVTNGTASCASAQEAEANRGTRREVAEAVGMSEAAYARAKRVVETASNDDEDVEVRAVAAEAVKDMDAGEISISAADRAVKEAKSAKVKSEPVKSFGTKWPAAELEKRITDMAADGHTSEQMAAKLGIKNASYIRERAREFGIEIPADVVTLRARKMDHARIVRETVAGLEGTVIALDLLDVTQIEDLSEIDYWVTSLSDSLSRLKGFHKQLKEMTQ